MSGQDVTTAGDLLTLAELRALRRSSALRGAGLVVHAWAVIAGAMLLYVAWPSVFTLLVAVAVIGTRQLGLAILMHEAAHWLLFPSQPANTRVGGWLCAHPCSVTCRCIAGAITCIIATRSSPTTPISRSPRRGPWGAAHSGWPCCVISPA
jgi:hypothetical protein